MAGKKKAPLTHEELLTALAAENLSVPLGTTDEALKSMLPKVERSGRLIRDYLHAKGVIVGRPAAEK